MKQNAHMIIMVLEFIQQEIHLMMTALTFHNGQTLIVVMIKIIKIPTGIEAKEWFLLHI